MYIHVPTMTYPVKESQLKAAMLKETPNMSFAKPFIPPVGYALVAETEKPAHNPFTQTVYEGTPVLVGGQWKRQWLVRAATPEEMAEREEVLKSTIVNQVQQRLDAFALTRGYDNTESIAKYKDISDAEIAEMPSSEQPLVTKFRIECRYLAVITARTWAKLYLTLAEVKAGQRQVPSGFADIEPLLPALEWPV